MDNSEDIDEEELALAMSTELSRPMPAQPLRRVHSVTTVRDINVQRRSSQCLLFVRLTGLYFQPLGLRIPKFRDQENHWKCLYRDRLSFTTDPLKAMEIRIRSTGYGPTVSKCPTPLLSVEIKPAVSMLPQGTLVTLFCRIRCLTPLVWLCTVHTFEVRVVFFRMVLNHREGLLRPIRDIQISWSCDIIFVLPTLAMQNSFRHCLPNLLFVEYF